MCETHYHYLLATRNMQVTWVREEGLATIQQAQRDSRVVAWDGFGQIISLQDLMRLEWRYIYIYIIRVAVYRIKADDDEGNFAGLDFLCEEPFPQY